jgi:hypothetical protein
MDGSPHWQIHLTEILTTSTSLAMMIKDSSEGCCSGLTSISPLGGNVLSEIQSKASRILDVTTMCLA